MVILITLLQVVVGIGSLICWILVLIKLFPAEGPLKGILGIICSLYAFIWGWMNADGQNIRKIMQIWTGCVIVGIVCAIAGAVMQQTSY
jgi:hypothetical protein